MPILKLLVEGADMKPSPAIAQQLGPLGINIGKVISEVNSATKNFKGITVPVNLDVNPKTKNFTIKVLSPPTSQLIKKELGIELASGARKNLIVGNIAFEQLISIAKVKQENMLSKSFLAALKSVIGSCLSMGILIDSKDPKDILADIEEGKYKKEIETQKSQASPEKLDELKKFFSDIKSRQDKAIQAQKAEQEAKEKEEKAKEQKSPQAKTPAPAAAAGGKTPAPAKAPAKKK
ncbi:MAG: 50S ribosomal protein L11 [Nanoarchaeota archaeon]